MRKNFLLALAVGLVVSLFVLSSCGGGGGSKPPTAPPVSNNGNNLPPPSAPSGLDQTSYRAEINVPTSPDSGEGALVLRHGVHFFSPDASDKSWTFGIRTWVKTRDGNPFQLDTYRWSGQDGRLNLQDPSQDKSSVVVRTVTLDGRDISPAVGVYTVGVKTTGVGKGKLVPLSYSVNTPPYGLWTAWLKFNGLYHTQSGNGGPGGSGDGDPNDSWLEELWGNINEWICPSATTTVTLAIDDGNWEWTGERWVYEPATPPPAEPTFAMFSVLPKTANLLVGAVQVFTTSAQDSRGNAIQPDVTWALSDPLIGSLSSVVQGQQQFTAAKPGVVIITAQAVWQGVSKVATAVVTVTLEPTPPPEDWTGVTVQIRPDSEILRTLSKGMGVSQAYSLVLLKDGAAADVTPSEILWAWDGVAYGGTDLLPELEVQSDPASVIVLSAFAAIADHKLSVKVKKADGAVVTQGAEITIHVVD
ncbi:MAG: hypothetical protein VE98_C0001G0139 [candidate division Kazan bacterium GW2011_GWA1_50_15]|uniref:BIG2 domain-containing protein n=2 Tax=Bacteria division Kazan-3B-28 TaxID=1798534 RepID=A0A0G1X7T3_UNCK3|nr:MAG: hypothetical protein VE98_C0001G0139 [candidate division Kazan bacterium GW2011_GWA1_50_15]KKW25585.1 MAG: hypothetical protein VE99_C0001G0222 [candidate division Kazan bacterium GW2011_GWC1_52_13]KKW26890.1 MAG: hypothetical protein VF00_C0002G0215 [candidate division Kazan bacterium GW2011_GWB1_52_7]HAV66118.1 hypothetical protein [Patescibacteria group bacterium]HCR42706.1 hypothetical protein [Patescibacteria group bacterium]